MHVVVSYIIKLITMQLSYRDVLTGTEAVSREETGPPCYRIVYYCGDAL